MRKFLLILAIIGVGFNTHAQLTIFEQNSKFGLKNESGDIVVRAEYDILLEYKNYSYYDSYTSLYIGNKGGKLITKTAKDSIWGYASDNYENYGVKEIRDREFKVFKGGDYYLFNAQGQQINGDAFENIALHFAAPVTYDYGDPYIYTYVPVDQDGNTKDTDRNLIKSGSPIMVKKLGKWGMMSLEPKYLVPCISDGLIEEVAVSEAENYYKIKKGKKEILYNNEGKAISREYDKIGYFNIWDYYDVSDNTVAQVINGGKIGYINIKGEEIIAPKYDHLIKATNNVYIFNKGGEIQHYEWIDSSAFLYGYEYEYAYDPDENYKPQAITVKDSLIKGGKFGVIKDGKEIIPASYTFIEYDATSGFYFGHTGGKEPENPKSYSYGDYGNYYGEYSYGYSNSGEYSHYMNVEKPIDSKRNLIDATGKVQIKEVEEISLNYINKLSRELDENGLYTTKNHYYHNISQKGKHGLVDENFKLVIPYKYAGFSYNSNIDNSTVIAFDEKNKYSIHSLTTGKVVSGEYAQILPGDNFYYYNKGGIWEEKEESYYDYYVDSNFTYKVTKLVGGKYGIIKSNNEDMGAVYDTIYVIGSIYNNNYYDYEYEYDYGYNYNSTSKPIVGFKKNNLVGTFTQNGDVGIPAQYSSITYDYSSKMLKVVLNGLNGLASPTGRIIIEPKYTSLNPVGYSYYGGTSSMFVVTNENELQGIIDTNGNVLFDFRYNWIDSYSWNQNNDIIKVSKNKLYGYADKEANEILPCEYEDINDYFNYVTKVSIITKNGKKGFFNRNEKKIVTEPKYSEVAIYDEKINGLTKVIVGGEVYWDSLAYMNKVRGGKIGYVDSTGREIIPPLYSNVTYNNEVELLMCIQGKARVYYTRSGQKVNDGESKWMSSYLGKKMMENSKINELKWNSARGPVGADATAFYYDEDGTYWLGTGSSGGVYRSTDKGNSWIETNKGIGPRHILFMDKINDTLFIVDQGTGSYTNYELYSGEFGYFEAVHYWNKATSSWVKVADWRKYTIADGMYTEANGKAYQDDVLQAINNYGGGSYFPPYLQNYYYYTYPFTSIGKYNSNTYSTESILEKGMPKDCYKNPAGNVFEVEDGNYVLLAKSGIYKFKTDTEVKTVSEKGLLASDITQTEVLPNGAIIAREGTSDIWKYENNNWTKLLDAYALNNELGKSDFGYYTGNFTVDNNGNILVPFRGNIYEIKPNGTPNIIAKSGSFTEIAKMDYSNEEYHTIDIIQAARDKNNKTWVLANARGYYGNNYGVVELNADGTINYDADKFINSYGIAFMFTDKKGNVWKYLNNKISMVGNEEKTTLNANYWDFNTNHVAIGNNGEIAVLNSYSGIAIFVPEKNKWVEVAIKGASNISSMEYDEKGNLMVSTNYEFEYFCGEDNKIKKADPVLGYIEFSMEGVTIKALNNPVNPRVLSLTQHPTLGILVGTSGSGLHSVMKK